MLGVLRMIQHKQTDAVVQQHILMSYRWLAAAFPNQLSLKSPPNASERRETKEMLEKAKYIKY